MSNEQFVLFPKAHREVLISTLENYEKEANDRMQKTIDAITKKKEELEIIGNELKTIRQVKKYAEEMIVALEPVKFPSEEK